MMLKKICLPLMAAMMMTTACHRDGLPDGVLDARAMESFMADAYMLEGFYAVETQYRYDAMPEEVLRAYDGILEKHGLTREQVEKSFEYYSQHPELYKPIQDSVMALLDRQITQ